MFTHFELQILYEGIQPTRKTPPASQGHRDSRQGSAASE